MTQLRVIYISPVTNIDYICPLRSYRGRSFSRLNVTIVEAILVSLASPTDLGPIPLGEEDERGLYINAGSSGHNPTKLLLQETQDLLGQSINVASIISFGSGKLGTGIASPFLPTPSHPFAPPTSMVSSLKPLKLPLNHSSKLRETLQQLLVSGEGTHEDLEGRTENLGVYFRFNEERYVGTVSIHDLEHASQIIEMTMGFLQESHINKKLNRAIELAKDPTYRVRIGLISMYFYIDLTVLPRLSISRR